MKKRLLVVLVALAAVLGITLWFLLLTTTSADTMGDRYPQILIASLSLFLFFIALLGWQIGGLLNDIRARIFGAQLKLRLMLMFGIVTVIPGLLIYAVSAQFITRSIESWFDVRVEKALESGLSLGHSALDYLREEVTQRSRGIAREISGYPEAGLRSHLIRMREQAAVDSIALFSSNGQLLLSSQRDLSMPLPPYLPSSAELKQAQTLATTQANMASIMPLVFIEEKEASEAMTVTGETADQDKELRIRVLLPVETRYFFEKPRILQLTQYVPETLSQNAAAVQSVYGDYQELQLARQAMTRVYVTILTFTLLVALFAAFALALSLTRRFAAPLFILAEGAQAVAQGDYSQRKTVRGRDELGALTRSFNQMTQQLSEARQETERHRNELESARAYLESILANISSGVLVFDANCILRTLNEGAITILGDALSSEIHVETSAWAHFPALGRLLEERFKRANEEDWQVQTEVESPNEKSHSRHLLLRGSCLPAVSGGGFVVVFDDITRLISAQRSIAWGEVARRLAHEIKNPLTPIQLSAERLQSKLSEHLDGKDREILERATKTIVNQVLAMKRIVDDFRNYSRLPAPELTALDLNALISEVMTLYEHSHVIISTALDEGLPPVRGDANQLRQVIHNLLRNSEDALEGTESAEIRVRTEVENSAAILQISDNGCGFPADVLPRVFEPYVTTKSRGTGLGLPIVKKIVDEHHGEITVGNKPEGGAYVDIRLPLAKETEMYG